MVAPGCWECDRGGEAATLNNIGEAHRTLREPRRELVWTLGTTDAQPGTLELTATGVTTGDHPLASQRGHLRRHGILDSDEVRRCPAGQSVRVAGWVVDHDSRSRFALSHPAN